MEGKVNFTKYSLFNHCLYSILLVFYIAENFKRNMLNSLHCLLSYPVFISQHFQHFGNQEKHHESSSLESNVLE